jgi:hypothetical protein
VAKKHEVAVQRKDEHEDRNVVIVGLLLALIPLILVFLAWAFGNTCLSPSYSPCGRAQVPPAGNGTIMATCIDGGLCGLKIILYGMFPTFYTFVCLPLGVLLYLIDMKFNPEKKFKLRFLWKSLLIGGILGLVITTFLIPALVESFL